MLIGNKGDNKVNCVNIALEVIWKQSSIRDVLEIAALSIFTLLPPPVVFPGSMPAILED